MRDVGDVEAERSKNQTNNGSIFLVLTVLQDIFDKLIAEVQTDCYRALYSEFNLKHRLTGVVGPRGVGKTTLLLQYIKNNLLGKDVFYFSADHICFHQMTIYEFVEELVRKEGINLFFIDEIHRYKNWAQELKSLHDDFPALRMVFAGSPSLVADHCCHDLSSCAKWYRLPGLSFREYLNVTTGQNFERVGLDDILSQKKGFVKELSAFPRILGHFRDYLKQGFYPFFREDPLSYYEGILSVIEDAIYRDIADVYHLKTVNLSLFKKILNFLAEMPPGKISTYNLGKKFGIDNKTVSNYLLVLQEVGLIELIYSVESERLGLRKHEKVFLKNTNLYHVFGAHQENLPTLDLIRELFFIQSVKNANLDVFYDKRVAFYYVRSLL